MSPNSPNTTPEQTTNSEYHEAISQLLSLADFERKSRVNDPPDFHLKRIERLLKYIGDPHLGKKYIHVAGSKGKGSTSAMIAWALAANGYTTGLFTSPSIHTITERFRINGKPISKRDFTRLVHSLWPAVEKVTADGDIGIVSVFELETAMAFCHFANSNADISVIEVGLGGRLDSTNIITPLVSVITPISLDHVAILGDTIELIAGEKAGIIKPGIPVVTSPQKPEAHEVIRNRAKSQNSELIESESSVKILNSIDKQLDGTELQFEIDDKLAATHLRLLGPHQIDNVRTAFTVLNQLNNSGTRVNFKSATKGIENVHWPARNQLVTHNPTHIFVDGAHNDASAQALRKSIDSLFPELDQLILILGTVRGHAPAAVAKEFMSLNPKIIATESRHPKSLTNFELSESLGSSKIAVFATATDTTDALKQAKSLANDNDLILATGSLFVAAEIIEIEHGIAPELYPDIKLPPRTTK
jgi:dihydrofolate synthase / folylpolyglutamate synthase